jgi:hypothetical protein
MSEDEAGSGEGTQEVRKAWRWSPVPEHERLATIVGAGVAVVSLAMNLFQAVHGAGLAARQSRMADELTRKDLDLKAAEVKLRDAELENAELTRTEKTLQTQVQRLETTVDIHQRYLIVSDRNLGRFLEKTPRGVFTTDVLTQFTSFLGRPQYDYSDFKWELIEAGVDNQPKHAKHALVLLHLRNRGKQLARGIRLGVRERRFRKMEKASKVWLLDPVGWPARELDLGDLSPGQEKFVPLMHLIGFDRYAGLNSIPSQLSWVNPLTNVREITPAGKLLPFDQWQIEGLTYASQG